MESDAPQERPGWGLFPRLGFRFVFLYFVLYTVPPTSNFPLALVPWPDEMVYLDAGVAKAKEQPGLASLEKLTSWREKAADKTEGAKEKLQKSQNWLGDQQNEVVDRVATETLDLDEGEWLTRTMGSGDPRHEYVHVALMGVLAAAGAILWTLIALLLRVATPLRIRDHRFLARLLHLGCRYYLAMYMLIYGFAKVTQFSAPSPSRLLVPYGEASPMNLLWTFMGASQSYTAFAGAGECLAGLLLLFRRTTTLGALLTAGVMANVAALNYSYDVPVKLFSTHLVIFALALALPDLGRLLKVFLLNRPAPARELHGLFDGRAWAIGSRVVKWIVVLHLLVGGTYGAYRSYEMVQERKSDRPPWYGVWDVVEFRQDETLRPPLLTDPHRPQNLVVDWPGFGAWRWMDDRFTSVGFQIDEENSDEESGSVRFSLASQWRARRDEAGQLVLEGEFSHWARKHPHWRGVNLSETPDPRVMRDPQLRVTMSPADDLFDDLVDELADDPAEEVAPVGDQGEGAPVDAAPAALPGIEPLVGRWQVEAHDVIGDLLSSRRQVPREWSRLEVDASGAARFHHADGVIDEYRVSANPDGTFSFSASGSFDYRYDEGDPETPGDEILELEGSFAGHARSLRLHRRDPDGFLLTRRGFHWINDFPLNR